MKSIKEKLYPRSVKRNVLAGFLLAFIAILLAFTITHFAFRDMLATVEDLSEPSGKLTLLNRVFQEITTLDQLQRAEAIKNPNKPHSSFLNQSQRTISLIDSMIFMDWNTQQRERIASMKEILRNRDSLFFSYLKQKSSLIHNQSLSQRIDTLSHIIEQKKIEIDSSVITTEKRTTTTYVKDTLTPKKDERTFFGKIFGKKKKNPSQEPVQLQVQEELSVVVDTVAIAKQNKALEEVEKIVQNLETDQRTQNKKLLARELELIDANSQLVSQLLSILREVETEEVAAMHQKSNEAGYVVSESIKRISILLLLFFLGAALLVYLIWIDISRSNYYKMQLEKARDEAEQLSLIKERFLANMSHEIRTPLQSIIGFAEHIKRQQTLDREAVDAIYSSSEHLLHIVNEVLDYSRISSGNFTFAREDFALMDVIREVEAAMRIQANKKQLSLLLDVEQSTDHNLVGDSFRLRQILYNVLGNAVKFTTKGFVKLAVRTETTKAKGVICHFEITDTGIGIKAEDISRIFNQFEQADTSITRNFGGTGLGLTIVKSLIEAQGGHLRVNSVPGKGSTFTITIPYEFSELGGVAKEQPAPIVVPNQFLGKVLVVDDDPMILRLCGLILKKNQVEHTLYSDSEELLHVEPQADVTHILMDIRMPKINGVDLCKALKKKYSNSTTFVALTAHVFEKDKKHLYEEGFDKVLSKPFHEEEVLNLLGLSLSASADTAAEVIDDDEYVIDLAPLRQITLYDDSLLQSVIQQFVEETAAELTLLDSSIAVNDKKVVREVFHKVAGRVGQIGVGPLSLQLREVEGRIENGEDFSHIRPTVLLLKGQISKLLNAMSKIAFEKMDR
jgi:signal transduction histidine kinase/DNA-binding response OmpR family regulator